MNRLLTLAATFSLLLVACDLIDDADDPVDDGSAIEATGDDQADVPDTDATPAPALDDENTDDVSDQIDVQARDVGYGESPMGTIRVFGLMENLGDERAEIREVTVNLLDDAGNVIEASTAFSYISVVDPGDTAPFQYTFTRPVDEFSDVEIVVEARTAGDAGLVVLERYRDFEATQVDWEYVDLGITITGEIANTGDRSAELVEVFAVGYDAGGNLQFVGMTYAEDDIIDPEGSSTFIIDYLDDSGLEPAEIRILAEAWLADE